MCLRGMNTLRFKILWRPVCQAHMHLSAIARISAWADRVRKAEAVYSFVGVTKTTCKVACSESLHRCVLGLHAVRPCSNIYEATSCVRASVLASLRPCHLTVLPLVGALSAQSFASELAFATAL